MSTNCKKVNKVIIDLSVALRLILLYIWGIHFFFDMSTQGKGERRDFHFIKRDQQPIKLPLLMKQLLVILIICSGKKDRGSQLL